MTVIFFGGNDIGGGGNTKNMAVNRHITGTAHQGGNFTAGTIPRTTLNIFHACLYLCT